MITNCEFAWFPPENEFDHDEHRKHIGGSDAGQIAGLSPWGGPITVFLAKTGQTLPREDSERMMWGRILEENVAREFTRRTGKKLFRVNQLQVHPEHSFMAAHFDRRVVGEPAIAEVKVLSEFTELKKGDIPPYILCQCYHYLAFPNVERTYLAALIGGNKMVVFLIERKDHEDDIRNLIEIERRFWEEHVLTGIPPEPDDSPQYSEYLAGKFPESNGACINLPEDAAEHVRRYNEAQALIKQAEAVQEDCKNNLKALMQENSFGICGGSKVVWSSYNRHDLDRKRLKEERPDIYEEYGMESTVRKFEIKPLKEGRKSDER